MSDFILPDIGEGIVECELIKWLISEGDAIEEDQPVAEVMTDKALVEIPAPHAGRVTRLYYQEGDTARVHAPLFAVEEAVASDASAADAASHAQPVRPEPDAPAPAPTDAGGERSEDFMLADIGEGIVECEVVEWRIKEGDEIEEDQPVVDVMTDKAMVEITAPQAGRVTRLYYRQHEHARVHSPLFAFVPRDGSGEQHTAEAGPAEKPAATPPETTLASASTKPAHNAPGTKHGGGAYGRIPASPAVRRRVRELGVRLDDIAGSGKQGRVLKEDVLAFEKRHQSPASAAATSGERSAASRDEATGEVRVEPIRGIRAAMARRMSESAASIPHFSYGDEIDVTELLALRERLKAQAEQAGTRLTLMPLIMKALALALQAHPVLNSRVNEAVSEIHYQPHCNIGMAVDSRAGLMVPNVKRVESLTLLEIAHEVARLTEAAREGRVSQADLADGTISISNIGALGGTYAAPIINPPEVAIVALGRTQWLPRFDAAGQVVSRAIMTVTWSGDHRIIDGGAIARFCNQWKRYLEDPQSMLLEMS